MKIRDYFQTHRLQLMIAVLAVVVLAVAVLWTAVAYVRPMPPRILTMVTGPEGGAYYEFGKRYREILAREGIELRLLPTAGAIENLALLRDQEFESRCGFSAERHHKREGVARSQVPRYRLL